MHGPFSLQWLHHRAPALVGISIAVAMCASFAWQAIEWAHLLETGSDSSPSGPAQMFNAQPLSNLEPLFGPVQVIPDNTPPPSTNLRLTLLGSFVHETPEHSIAIIQYEGGKPRRFRAGEEITTGVRLHAVYRDRVELERAGRRESLSFPPPRSRIQASGSASPGQPASNVIDDLSGLQEDNAAELRERMEKLRQEMEESGSLPADDTAEQPLESE